MESVANTSRRIVDAAAPVEEAAAARERRCEHLVEKDRYQGWQPANISFEFGGRVETVFGSQERKTLNGPIIMPVTPLPSIWREIAAAHTHYPRMPRLCAGAQQFL